eukprot:gene6067-6523_t
MEKDAITAIMMRRFGFFILLLLWKVQCAFNAPSTMEPTVKPTGRRSYKPTQIPTASREGEEGEEEDDDERQANYPSSSTMPSQAWNRDRGDGDDDEDEDGEQSRYTPSPVPSVVAPSRKTRTRSTSPSFQTTLLFTAPPSVLPTRVTAPSFQPTALPTNEPTINPSISRSFQPTAEGTTTPSFQTASTTTLPSQSKFPSPNPTYNPTIPHEISISTLSIELLLYAIAFGIILGTIVTSAICCCIYFMLYPRPPTQSALSVLNPANTRYSPLPTSYEQNVEMIETPLH